MIFNGICGDTSNPSPFVAPSNAPPSPWSGGQRHCVLGRQKPPPDVAPALGHGRSNIDSVMHLQGDGQYGYEQLGPQLSMLLKDGKLHVVPMG